MCVSRYLQYMICNEPQEECLIPVLPDFPSQGSLNLEQSSVNTAISLKLIFKVPSMLVFKRSPELWDQLIHHPQFLSDVPPVNYKCFDYAQ